jgi:hypothetical protein
VAIQKFADGLMEIAMRISESQATLGRSHLLANFSFGTLEQKGAI